MSAECLDVHIFWVLHLEGELETKKVVLLNAPYQFSAVPLDVSTLL